MTPIAIVAQLLLQYGPDIANEFAKLFFKPATAVVTIDEWNAVFAKLQTYDQLAKAAGVTS